METGASASASRLGRRPCRPRVARACVGSDRPAVRHVEPGGEATGNRPVLVDLAKLHELIAELDLGDPKRNDYLKARWLKYVEWWDSRAAKAKWKYLSLRSAVVIGGAAIPALVAFHELPPFAGFASVFSVASIVVSLVIAICAGLESLFGFGDIWREKRNAAEIIKSEGFSFLERIGKYQGKTHAEAYETFAASVEDLILGEIREYIVAVSPKQVTGPTQT